MPELSAFVASSVLVLLEAILRAFVGRWGLVLNCPKHAACLLCIPFGASRLAKEEGDLCR